MKRVDLVKVLQSSHADLKVSRGTLSIDMTRQASLYFFYAQAWTKAVADEKRAKLDLSVIETKLWRKLVDHHPDRVTERVLSSECGTNRGWLKAKAKLNEAAACADALEKMCKAMDHRRDMLVNLSATARAEMSGDIAIKKRKD